MGIAPGMSLSAVMLGNPAPLAPGPLLRKLNRLRSGIHGVDDGLCDGDCSSLPSFFLRKTTSTTAMDMTAKAPQIEPKTMAKFCFFNLADDGSTTTTGPEPKCIFMISIPFRMGPGNALLFFFIDDDDPT